MVDAVGEVEERVYELGGRLDDQVILQDAARYRASERSALWDRRHAGEPALQTHDRGKRVL
jgi:hypothetical protein